MVDVVGIDEAGRGPLLGPLVLCGILIDEKNIDSALHDAKDSKLLTSKKREMLYTRFSQLSYKLVIVLPSEIDVAVDSETTNLNWLEAEKTAQIINFFKPKKAFVDCPSPNIDNYRDYLLLCLKDKSLDLILGHKMESKSKVVAAASIIAKVIRDREIEKLRKKYGNFGSGYPADPVTKRFLEKNWKKYPELFRRSWSSWKKYAFKEKQETLK